MNVGSMNVVERGLARCPYCVAVTQYAFVETGPNSRYYQVDCKRCGEQYRELQELVPQAAVAVAVTEWAPEPLAEPSALRERAADWAKALRERVAAVASSIAATAHAWL